MRNMKYDFLNQNSLKEIDFSLIKNESPYYFFVEKDYSIKDEYLSGFNVNELFNESVTGVLTARDHLVIDFDKNDLIERIEVFTDDSYSDQQIRDRFFGNRTAGKYPAGDTRGWKLNEAREKIRGKEHDKITLNYSYRPFDTRKI